MAGHGTVPENHPLPNIPINATPTWAGADLSRDTGHFSVLPGEIVAFSSPVHLQHCLDV